MPKNIIKESNLITNYLSVELQNHKKSPRLSFNTKIDSIKVFKR